jgi:hypothetical protein
MVHKPLDDQKKPPQKFISFPKTQTCHGQLTSTRDVANGIEIMESSTTSKHFPHANYLRTHKVVQDSVKAAPPVSDFLDWFPSLTTLQATPDTDALNGGLSRSWHVCHRFTPSKATRSQSARLLLTPSTTALFPDGDKCPWPSALAIGQFNYGADNAFDYRAGFLCLYHTATMVFRSQPTRRFLHAFYIYQSKAEFWTFDHAGMYCSGELDMLSDFATILSTLLCLRLTIDEKLGMSKMVKHDEAGRSYVEADLETVTSPQASSYKSKLFLDDEPISISRRQFSESMACYRARLSGSAGEYIVKFNWEVWWRHREPKLLQLAKKKNV